MGIHMAVLLVSSMLVMGQERFGSESERLRGFTKSPTEHIMNEHPAVISVRTMKGRITEAASKTGVPAAVVEVRKTDPREKVQGTKSDANGHFQLRRLKEGEYVFKVTRDGFQSVFGRVRISKNAPSRANFDIELKQGV